jgi:tetratricopeptide (TPR) repeat protein
LELGAGDGDLAIADFTEAIRLNPRYAMSYNNRGVARCGKGDRDGAITDLSEAIRIDPKYADAYFDRAAVWTRKGELNRAIADYTEAIRNNPKYQNAYAGRARAYERKGDFQRAQADRGEGVFLAAVEYAQQGNFDKAAECLTGAINYNPKNARAYYQRGLIREKKGEVKEAAADFAEAARLDASYATSRPTSEPSGGAPASRQTVPAKAQ